MQQAQGSCQAASCHHFIVIGSFMINANFFSNAESADKINLSDRILIIFFTFPLLAPAINETVIYPFVLAGLILFNCRRFRRTELTFMLLGAALLALCAVTDPLTSLRLLSFYFSCIFFAYVTASPVRLNFLITAGAVHAAIIVMQFLLLLFGIEVDFSVMLRAIYGPLLPGTGNHIDYNAFSQLDIFIPRVAGINREPAFAAVLFLGMGVIVWQRQQHKVVFLFALATLLSLSKVIFALLPAYALLFWSLRTPARYSVLAVVARTMVIILSQLIFYLFIEAQSPLFTEISVLDASFYHRFIGHLTVANAPGLFNILGSSWEHLTRMPDFVDYDFKDFQRGFFDGSVITKMLLDFGWLPTGFYIVAIAVLSRNWKAALALSFGGLFINLLSVSPSTVITFMNLCALSYLNPTPQPLRRDTTASLSSNNAFAKDLS